MGKSNSKDLQKQEDATGVQDGVLTLAGGKNVQISEIVKQLNDAEVGMELTSEYLALEEGEEIRAAVIGIHMMSPINENGQSLVGPDGKQIKEPAIRMITNEGKMVITKDAILVSTLQEAAEAVQRGESKPVPVLIQCFGWTKSPRGKYRDLKVKAL